MRLAPSDPFTMKWNYIDQLICGSYDMERFSRVLPYWRIRYTIIPKPSSSTTSSSSASTEKALSSSITKASKSAAAMLSSGKTREYRSNSTLGHSSPSQASSPQSRTASKLSASASLAGMPLIASISSSRSGDPQHTKERKEIDERIRVFRSFISQLTKNRNFIAQSEMDVEIINAFGEE